MNDIYLIGEVGYEITLQSVIDSVAKSDKEKPLYINIHSQGGSVYDGLAIYNYLKTLGQEVNTSSSGLVASIASIIFLAGKKETRKINSNDSFLIHLPMGFNGGNAKDLEKTAKELRDIENKLAEIYAKETNLTSQEAIELMAKDEMLDVNFLKEKGFVNTIVEFKAVANLYNNQNQMKQVTEAQVESMLTKFENKLKAIFNLKPTAKLVQDANGVEINFTELEDDATPSVGDVAQIDGVDANGEYVMPDGTTMVFVDGTLTEIMEAEDDEEEQTLEEAQAKIAELEAEIEGLKAEKDNFENNLKTLKAEFKSFKNEVSSNFKAERKPRKEGQDPKNQVRTLFKK